MRRDCANQECRTWRSVDLSGQELGSVRHRQFVWVVTEMHKFISDDTDCVSLLTGEGALEYLAAADKGELRSRKSARQDSTNASAWVRTSVMRELVTLTGAQGAVPKLPRSPERAWTNSVVRDRFLTTLRQDSTPHGLRIATVAHLAASGLRVGEIAGLLLDNVNARGDVTSVMRNPPGPGDPFLAEHSVDAQTAALVRGWVSARELIVASERVNALLVTLHPAARGGVTYTAGLPVSARSLDRDHRAAASSWLTGSGRHWVDDIRAEDLTLSRLAHQPERASTWA